MKLSSAEHCARIIEQIEHLVCNEDIPLIGIRAVLWKVQKDASEALKSVEDRLKKERENE